MNKQSKIIGTSVIPCAVVSAAVSVPAKEAAATSIGAASSGLRNPTVAAGAPNRDTYLDDGYGRQARCITCRKGMSNCLCDAPDIDVLGVHDMARIYPSLFGDRGWALAERSAYGMAVKL